MVEINKFDLEPNYQVSAFNAKKSLKWEERRKNFRGFLIFFSSNFHLSFSGFFNKYCEYTYKSMVYAVDI